MPKCAEAQNWLRHVHHPRHLSSRTPGFSDERPQEATSGEIRYLSNTPSIDGHGLQTESHRKAFFFLAQERTVITLARLRIRVACAPSDVPGDDEATAGIVSLFINHFWKPFPKCCTELATQRSKTLFFHSSAYITVVSVRQELFGAVFFPKVPNNGHPVKSPIIIVFVHTSGTREPWASAGILLKRRSSGSAFCKEPLFWEVLKMNVRSVVHGSNEPESAVYDFSYLEYFTHLQLVNDDSVLNVDQQWSLEARCSLNMLCSAFAIAAVQCAKMMYEPEKNARSTTRTYDLQSSIRFIS
ncbi:hypothetical protein EDD85DRAFT_785221 [Armillaria nabsnona]|nr:hypothetical protein EDD85DRAFT_785221 [Armillaria nabsnona]